MISHRLQVREHLAQSGQGPIPLPLRRRGLYPLLLHKCRCYRAGTFVCTFVPPATRRSCPWRNSNIILSPITKRAGSPSSTASNDVVLTCVPFFHFGLPPTFHSASARSRPSAPFAGRPPPTITSRTPSLPLQRILDYTIISIPSFPLSDKLLSPSRHDCMLLIFITRPYFAPPFLHCRQDSFIE